MSQRLWSHVVVMMIGAAGVLLPAGWSNGQEKQDPPVSAAGQNQATPPAASGAAVTMPDTPAGRMMSRVLKAINEQGAEGSIKAEELDAAFLKQVPHEKLAEVFTQLRADHGTMTPVKIEKQDGERGLVVRAMTEKTHQAWSVMLHLTGEDKIDGLLLRPAGPGTDEKPLRDWNDFDDRARALPGRVSFAAYELRPVKGASGAGNEGSERGPKLAEVHTLHADERLAIGSAFKLYVLGALAEAVEGGTARWDEKLAIKDVSKSLPSGRMQDEKEGKEFSIAEFADLMISISDNTATDHLMHRIGREAIEAYMSSLHGKPALNKPFLTTREMFALKLKSDPTLIDRWLAVDEATRRDMLLPEDPFKPTRPAGATHNPGEVAGWALDIGAAKGWSSPRHIDRIEWFASADELCRLWADLSRLEKLEGMEPLGHAVRLNPGLPLDKKTWTQIAFKGGSEPGVLCLSWLLTRQDGKVFAVAVAWNDEKQALEEGKMLGLITRAIEQVGK